jgi:hypothetical protein
LNGPTGRFPIKPFSPEELDLDIVAFPVVARGFKKAFRMYASAKILYL